MARSALRGTAARAALKAEFLRRVGSVSSGASKAAGLRSVIEEVLLLGLDWRDLFAWADQAGYLDRYTRKVISELLQQFGIRQRRSGAGQKTPPAALAIMASVHAQHGVLLGNKFLLAACRAGKTVARIASSGGATHKTVTV